MRQRAPQVARNRVQQADLTRRTPPVSAGFEDLNVGDWLGRGEDLVEDAI